MGQERHDRFVEVLDVLGLRLLTASQGLNAFV